MSRDSLGGTIRIAAILCVVCSLLVSGATVMLRPRQQRNAKLDRYQKVLALAGKIDPKISDIEKEYGKSLEELYQEYVTPMVIDLATGQVSANSEELITAGWDQEKAEKDPQLSTQIPADKDVAGVGRRENQSYVFVIKDKSGAPEQYILPIRGKGLWSTMRGFISVDRTGKEVRGLTFFKHGETPGLGAEIDNPKWQAQWPGKQIFGADDDVALQVLRGQVDQTSPAAIHQVDGLSGATITSRGVEHTMRYWLSDEAFGKFLDSLPSGAGDAGKPVAAH